jgi:FAD/FMN-containing dehydrogenase
VSRDKAGAWPRRTAAAFADTEADARKWLEPLADGPQLPQRHPDLFQEASFASLDEVTSHMFLEDRRCAADAFTFNATPGEVLTRLQDQAVAAPSPESFMLLAFPSPRPPDAPALPDMAFSMPGSIFAGIYAIWQDPAQDVANRQWVRQASKAVDPITVGRYIGETDLTADASHAQQSFTPPNWQRLRSLRQKYDPYDVFFDYLGPG